MHRSWNLIVGLIGAIALVGSAHAQGANDQLACYRVQDPAAKTKFTTVVTNAGVTQSCTVKVPAKLGCLQSQTSGVVPTPPGGGPTLGDVGDFLCYKLKCPQPFPPAAQTTDRWGGERVVTFRAAQFLCAPATRGAETVGATTTTTLAATGPCSFNSSDRRCEGTCSGGGHCSAVTSGGDCECQSTSCGDASAPSCAGFCDSGESCIFSITGCSCVRIP